MNMKFWKNPNISEAKKLEKMPEYNKFADRLSFYNELRSGSKHLNVYVDSLEAFKGNQGFHAMVRNDLEGHLNDWKASSNAIFLQEIEKTRGELVQDAEKLLAKTEIKDENSKPMVLLEEADLSYKKIGRRLVAAGGIGMAVSLIMGFFPSLVPVIRDVIGEASAAIGLVVSAYGSVVIVVAGISLAVHGGFKDTIETFNKAIGIARGEPESEEYKKSSWNFRIH